MQIGFLIEKLYTTYKRQGIPGIFTKSIRRLNSAHQRFFINKRSNKKKWKQLQNKYLGQRVFLIGNGPSLNKTPLYLLRDEYTMCFNRFSLLVERINWSPTFFTTTDNLVLNDLVTELESIIPTTTYSFFPDIHFRGDRFIDKIAYNEKVLWLHQLFGKGFSTKLPKIFPGGSVIYEGFQILNYLGFKEIIVLGVDMNFQLHKTAKYLDSKSVDIVSEENDDPNHFDPRYFGKNRKYHQPEDFVVQSIIDNLDYLGQHMENFGLRIVNAGFDSKITSFPKGGFDSLFSFNDDEKEKLFSVLLLKDTGFNTIDQFEKEAEFFDVRNVSDYPKGNFYTATEQGLGLIKKAIFTHIPLGPYQNKYYFKKR